MSNNKNMRESVRNQYIAAIVANIAIFNQGNAVGWVSPALITLCSPSSPLGAPLTLMQTSLIASTFCVGAIVGTPLFGWIVETLGRRKALLITSFPYMVCWSIKIFWMNPYAIIFSRFILGVGSAGAVLITPLYVSEIASVNSRGTLGSFFTFSINAGILFEYIIGAYMGYFSSLYILISIPILSLVLVMQMPESPSDLVKADKLKEAAEALGWLRSLPVDSMIVKNEMDRLVSEAKVSVGGNNSVEDKAHPDQEKMSAFRFLVNSPPSMRALVLTTSLLTAQCLTGIFAVISYASTIFAESGSTLTPAVSSIVVGALQFLGSIVASSLIDRLGRKILFVGSCSCVSLAMASLGTYFYVRDVGYDVSSLGWIPVLALSTVVCTFSMGTGPVPFILPAEVFMIQVRGLATTIGLTWLWIMTFFVAQFYTSIVAMFGSHIVFWGFSAVGCVAVFISVVFQPETKGVPVEQTVAFFSRKKDKATRNPDEEVGELFRRNSLVKNATDAEKRH